MNKFVGFLREVSKIGIGFYFLFPSIAVAQITPDRTLPNNSVLDRNGNLIKIDGGTTAGENLFHSFERFSVGEGQTAYFNNANIQNIFSRVTGSSISNIDGILRANGAANLFLINPNGIIFGENARLDIGGSFLGSTADSIVFADGFEFSASNPDAPPLLTVKVPIGLGFLSNPGAIQVRGTGHKLQGFTSIFSSIIRDKNTIGLSVAPGETIALIGGNVTFDGGILTAEGGRVEVGSVGSGLVGLNLNERGFSLNYDGVSKFRDLVFSQQSLLDASGENSGFIQIQGNNTSFTNGSIALVQNQGNKPSGSITINATESLNLRGLTSDGRITSNIRSEAIKEGKGGDINISTSRLQISDGSRITTRTYGEAQGGNLSIISSDSVKLRGFTLLNQNSVNSAISAITANDGKAGDVVVSTSQLTLEEGGTISSFSFGKGNAGNITVNANDILLSSQTPLVSASLISVSALTGGRGGNIRINTSNLLIRNSAAVSSSAIGSSSAGNVFINARSISASSEGQEENNIRATVVDAGKLEQELFGSSPNTTGDAGSIEINTRELNLTGTSKISVTNEGTGISGNIAINANSIFLNDNSAISAMTKFGNGGNITLNASDFRLNDSTITATAGGQGNGGDVTINTDTLVISNSDITANASQGNGGNIAITTRGLFRSPDSEITASSDLGVDGTVEIRVLQPLQLESNAPETTIKTEELLASSCFNRTVAKGSFRARGSEGIPLSFDSGFDTSGSAIKIPKPDPTLSQTTLVPTQIEEQNRPWQIGDPVVEPNLEVTTPDGEILLLTVPENPTPAGVSDLFCQLIQPQSGK